MTTTWLLVAIGVLLLVHVAVLVYAAHSDGRRSRGAHSPRSGTGPTPGDGGAETSPTDGQSATEVDCPECGASNRREFKYCRQCLAELPTGASFVRRAAGGRSRRTR